MPASADPRIGVVKGGDHTRYAGLDQRLGAGRCLTMVAAGLEGHIGRRAARFTPGRLQCHCFGVRPAALPGPAARDDTRCIGVTLIDQDAADRRIWPNTALSAILPTGGRPC